MGIESQSCITDYFLICFDAVVSCGSPPTLDLLIPGDPTGVHCNDTVNYSCDVCSEGNGLSGESICQPDGTWSIPELICTRK